MVQVSVGNGKQLVEVIVVGDNIYITQGYRGNDGDFKPEMCKKKNWDSKQLDDVKPLSVYMGKDKGVLLNLAQQIIEKFKDEEPGGWENDQTNSQDMPPTPFDDDVPF